MKIDLAIVIGGLMILIGLYLIGFASIAHAHPGHIETVSGHNHVAALVAVSAAVTGLCVMLARATWNAEEESAD